MEEKDIDSRIYIYHQITQAKVRDLHVLVGIQEEVLGFQIYTYTYRYIKK